MNSTTTNGLPVFAIASISSCCLPGRSMFERDAASPLISRDSPRASTTWSAALAFATASANPSVVPHSLSGVFAGGSRFSIVQPWLNVALGDCALIPV